MKPDKKVLSQPSMIRDTRGLSTVEYVIVLALIAVTSMVVWQKFGGKVKESVKNSDASFDTNVLQNSAAKD